MCTQKNLDAGRVPSPGQGNIGLTVGEEVTPHVESNHVKSLPLGLVSCHAKCKFHWKLLPAKGEGKGLRLRDADDPGKQDGGAPDNPPTSA